MSDVFRPANRFSLRRWWNTLRCDVKYVRRRVLNGFFRKLGYVYMEPRSNAASHAELEFRAANWDLKGDRMQAAICEDVLDLLRVFSGQGHSGTSAPYALNLFKQLAMFEPIVPLTGEDWEWVERGDGRFQNKRCSHVFKDKSQFNGQAYDSEAVIFLDADGSCSTNRESRQPITFPYTPTHKYEDRP